VIRQDHVIVPRGDTLLIEGDEVLVLVTNESEEDLKKILVGG
jgi:Trk K+ transport system NAD-binding subunit